MSSDISFTVRGFCTDPGGVHYAEPPGCLPKRPLAGQQPYNTFYSFDSDTCERAAKTTLKQECSVKTSRCRLTTTESSGPPLLFIAGHNVPG